MTDPDDELGQGFDEGELFEFPLDPAEQLDEAPDATHRGAFGEHGGASSTFIERTFRERIVLVGVATGGASLDDVEAGLDELARLVDTAGADPVARVVQRRDTPDPATYIGKGKVEELRTVAEATDCDTVVFDEELSPAQQRNLEKLLGRTAIDRTAVILDIFAQNASSQEGKAQVDLALLRYRLPRLRGKGQGLSQQGGGIGTRQGGGETKLEVDRRRIVRRIHQLESELRAISRHRATQRKARSRSRVQQVAIVGYTNAGKSTLLNRLTDAGVLVEDRLFATLDATTRRLQLPGGEAVLLTDTVGFVRKLPHGLVEAFKSTLDVVVEADLLIHVVDGSLDRPARRDRRGARRARRDRCRPGARAAVREQGRPRAGGRHRRRRLRRRSVPLERLAPARRPPRIGRHLGAHRPRHRRAAPRHRRPAARPHQRGRAARALRPRRPARRGAPRG